LKRDADILHLDKTLFVDRLQATSWYDNDETNYWWWVLEAENTVRVSFIRKRKEHLWGNYLLNEMDELGIGVYTQKIQMREHFGEKI